VTSAVAAHKPGAAPREPDADCPLCPRLAGFRAVNTVRDPRWHNAPVASFGDLGARLLIVGLAPGLKGANATGRPFTGDYAGDLLYATLAKFGLAEGTYGAAADDGLRLVDCRITNAVRCVPPGNRPTGVETKACGPFLAAEIAAMTRLRAVLALGTVAHGAVLAAVGERKNAYKFAHGTVRPLASGVMLADSYHCSRYNTNTGRLTEAMFEAVFAAVTAVLAPPTP